MNEPFTDRIDKIESHVAHLDRQIDQLNEVAVEQSREMDRLKKLVGRLSLSLESAELDRVKSVDSKPPHYQ